MRVPFQMDLSGKVAVVTGAGGILCSSMAHALAECGASVALLDLNRETAEEQAANIYPSLSLMPKGLPLLSAFINLPPNSHDLFLFSASLSRFIPEGRISFFIIKILLNFSRWLLNGFCGIFSFHVMTNFSVFHCLKNNGKIIIFGI